jgi:hypothetical protein
LVKAAQQSSTTKQQNKAAQQSSTTKTDPSNEDKRAFLRATRG